MKLDIENLKEGMVIEKRVTTSMGVCLMQTGTVVTTPHIERLKAYRIKEVFIDDFSISNSNQIIASYRNCIKQVKDIFEEMKMGNTLPLESVQTVVTEVMDNIITRSNLLETLVTLKSIDDYTYVHSLNVCIYSLLAATAMGYTGSKLISVGTGAVLHDIGKCFIPLEILNKESKLTNEEFEIIKNHSLLGYKSLSNYDALDKKVLNIILNHHEKLNGKGYPNGIDTVQIEEPTRIVSVCDVYDALTTDRPYRKAFSPLKAIQCMIEEAIMDNIDSDVLTRFAEQMDIYPMGAGVKFPNGDIGIIVENHGKYALKPKVQIICTVFEGALSSPHVIDLYEHPNLKVIEIFDPASGAVVRN